MILFDLLDENFSSRGTAAADIEKSLQPLEQANALYLYLLTIDGRLAPVRGLPLGGQTDTQRQGPPWTRRIKPILDRALEAVLRMRPISYDYDPAYYNPLRSECAGGAVVIHDRPRLPLNSQAWRDWCIRYKIISTADQQEE